MSKPKDDEEKKVVKPAIPTTNLPEVAKLQSLAPRSATRGEVKQSERAAKVAKSEAEVYGLRAHSAKSIADIGKSLVSWTDSLLKIQENKHKLDVQKVHHERELKDATNDAFLDDAFRDKRNAIKAMGVDDDFATAEANSEYVRLALQERLIGKRKDVELARRDYEAVVKQDDPVPLVEAMKQQEAYARLIVRDAADNVNVKTDARHLYNAFVACHYIAGRMRGLGHEDLLKDLVHLVVDRMRFNPIEYDDAMDYQKRWQTLKNVAEARAAEDRSAAREAQERQARLMVEQLKKEQADAAARTAEANRSIYGNPGYNPKE